MIVMFNIRALKFILVVLVSCHLSAVSCWARTGMVTTREGRTVRGHVRLTTQGITLINSSNQTITTIDSADVTELSLDQPTQIVPDILDLRASRQMPSWQERQIGSCEGGWSEPSAGIFRMRCNGTNIAGRADAFDFVFRSCTGNCEVVARVVTTDLYGPTKAGLMIRESLTPGSPNLFVGVSGRRGGVLQHRRLAGQETEIESKSTLFVPYWLRLKRFGNQFTAYSSANGTHWLPSESVNVPMTEGVCAGLALASGGDITMVSAMFDNIRQDTSVPHTSFIPEVHLQSGSTIVGPILSGTSERFDLETFPLRVPGSTVSHILFRWLPLRHSALPSSGHTGVLLTSGEFIEGDFSRLSRDSLTMSSVLYGMKSFDADAEVVAVILRRPYDTSSRYTLVTLDGSILYPKKVQFDSDELTLTENSLGTVKIGLPDLLWLRCAQ